MKENIDFSEELEYCEFRIYNITREKNRIDKITNVLKKIAVNSNSMLDKLYRLKYSLLTINDKAVIDKDYNQAYAYYVCRFDSLTAEELSVEEEYQKLIKKSADINRLGIR